MEYYGYKPKDIDKSYIDWAGITKGISEEIRSVANERQEQRNQLEADHLKSLQTLSDFEKTMDPSLNSFLLKGAQSARDYRSQIHKQMKSGVISVDQAKLISQNLMDNYTGLNNAIKALGDNIQTLSEADGKGNQAVADAIKDFLDFNNNVQTIDPETGEIFLAKRKKDGSLDTSNAIPYRGLAGVVGQKFDFVDVESATDKIADSAGTWKQVFASGASVEDPRQNPNYQKWIDNTITSNLNTDEKLASVLMDYRGMDYTTTNEEGKIQVEFDKSTGRLKPILTPAQEEEAKQAFRDSIEAKIGAVKKADELTKDEEIIRDFVLDIDKFVTTGNISNLNTVLKQYRFAGSEMTDEGLSFIKNDGTKTTVDIKPGMTASDIGAEIAGKIGITKFDTFSGSKEKQPSESIFNKDTYGIFETAPSSTMSSKDEQVYAKMFVFQDRDGMPYEGEQLKQAQQNALGGFKDYLSKNGMNLAGLSMNELGEVTYGTQPLGNITDGFYNLKTALTGNNSVGETTKGNKAPRPEEDNG
jgi:hypothetical protein